MRTQPYTHVNIRRILAEREELHRRLAACSAPALAAAAAASAPAAAPAPAREEAAGGGGGCTPCVQLQTLEALARNLQREHSMR